MAHHPLEPLSEDEFRQTAAVLRRDQGLTESWRFASIELQEPPKADGEGLARRATRSRARRFAVLWNRADNQTWEGVVDLTGDAVVSWTHVPGVTPQLHRRRVPRGRRGDARAPGRDRRAGRPRHHRHVAGADRGLDLRQGADAGAVARPPARLVRHLVPRDPGGQPLRAPGLRAQARRRHEHPRAARDRERPRPRPARGQRGVRPGRLDREPARPTSSRCTSPSPKASRSPSRAPS